MIISLNNFAASQPLCCDKEMIETMEENLRTADGIFGRCDTCRRNLRRSICEFNCSPKQSQFIDVKETAVDPKNETNGINCLF